MVFNVHKATPLGDYIFNNIYKFANSILLWYL